MKKLEWLKHKRIILQKLNTCMYAHLPKDALLIRKIPKPERNLKFIQSEEQVGELRLQHSPYILYVS